MDYGKEISEDKRSLERNCMIKKMEQIWDMIKHDTQTERKEYLIPTVSSNCWNIKEFICLDAVNF